MDNTEHRKCGLCGSEYDRMTDNQKVRVYSCDNGCGAYEVISKGSTAWWYHGAQLPEDMAPAWLEEVAAMFDEAAP